MLLQNYCIPHFTLNSLSLFERGLVVTRHQQDQKAIRFERNASFIAGPEIVLEGVLLHKYIQPIYAQLGQLVP